MESRLQALGDLVRAARRQGAVGVELLNTQWVGNVLQAERGRIVASSTPAGAHLDVRVWLEGGREGVARGTFESAATAIDAALAAAASAPEDPVRGPSDRLVGALGGLGIDDRRYAVIEDEDRVEVLTTAERAARAVDRRIVPGRFWYEDRRTLRTFANSKGIGLEEADTVYRAGGSASVAGETWTSEQEIEARTFASIASLPFGTSAGRVAIDVLRRGEALSGPVRVLLWPEATAALFAKIGEGFTSERLRSGAFFLQPREDGEPVVDARLHLVDDGTLPGALRSSSFDDRGMVPVPLALLREGRVDGRFIGLDEARRGDTRPTGHEVGGVLRPRNLTLRSGTRSVNVMLAENDGWVLSVFTLPDLSQVDLRTGQATIPVSGAVFHRDRHVGGMPRAVLRADLAEVLSRVVEVASNTDRVGHVDAPAILLDGFSID